VPAKAQAFQTPTLNPAQQLIEKFKAAKSPQFRAAEPQLRRSALMAVADPSIASETRSMLHVQLEPWCEVVSDTQRLKSLTPQEIERFGEILKRRLQNETAH
jgi:hypothetical protein